MATYSKRLLSGSTNGKGILVAATSSPGTTIHTAISGASDLEEVWIYAYNQHTADVALTIQWGGTAAEDGSTVTIPSKTGLQLAIPGLLLQNSLLIKAYASVTNVITIQGFVNRISA